MGNHDDTYGMNNGEKRKKASKHMGTSNHRDNRYNMENNLNISVDNSNRRYPDSVLHFFYSNGHNKMQDSN